jgi:hypothetical protein
MKCNWCQKQIFVIMDLENMDITDEVEYDDGQVCVICQDWLSTHIELANLTSCKYKGCTCINTVFHLRCLKEWYITEEIQTKRRKGSVQYLTCRGLCSGYKKMVS